MAEREKHFFTPTRQPLELTLLNRTHGRLGKDVLPG